MTRSSGWAAVSCACACACGGSDRGGSGDAPAARDPVARVAAAAAAAATVDDALVKDHLDIAALRDAVQGVWVVEREDRGLLAVEIEGERATLWDGRAITHATVDTHEPCRISFLVPSGQPGHLPGEQHGLGSFAYANVEGIAQLAGGYVGERIGRGAIVCTYNATFALDDAGRCTKNVAWAWVLDHPAQIDTRSTRCGFRPAATGGEEFFVFEELGGDRDRETVLPVDGHRIGDLRSADELRAAGLGRYADFATARAIADAEARANDPFLIGRAAGGRVGDLSTVPGLVATYGADPDALDDKLVHTGGVVVKRQDWTSDGYDPDTNVWTHRPGIDLTIADPAHVAAPTIECSVDGVAPGRGPVAGDRVRVRGRVHGHDAAWTKRSNAAPELGECELVATARGTRAR